MQVKTKIFTILLASYDDYIKLDETVNNFIADNDFVSVDTNWPYWNYDIMAWKPRKIFHYENIIRYP